MPHVAMFHIGRSGSSVLGDMLGQHPQLHWDGEIYQERLRAWRLAGRRERLDPATPVRRLARRIAANKKPVYGFEVKFFHLDAFGVPLKDYLEAARTAGVTRHIVLRRRNTLRKVASSLVARKTGRYQVRGGNKSRAEPVAIPVQTIRIENKSTSLLGLLQDYERSFTALAALLNAPERLDLFYEDDILPGPEAAYRRACGFLDLAPEAVEVRIGRSNPFPLEEIVSNMDEVRHALKGTPFAWMTDDKGVS